MSSIEGGGRPPEETGERTERSGRPTRAQLIERAKKMVSDLMRLPKEMRFENLEWYKDNLEKYSNFVKGGEGGFIEDEDRQIDYVDEYKWYGASDFIDLMNFLPLDIKQPELTSANIENVNALFKNPDKNFDPESRIRKFYELVFGNNSQDIPPDKLTQAIQLYQDSVKRYGLLPIAEIDQIYDILRPVDRKV